MTEQEKREREKFYQTVILSLETVPNPGYWGNSLDILKEVLPLYAEAGSSIEQMVRILLLGEMDSPMNEKVMEFFPTENDIQETKNLYKTLEKVNSDTEWDEIMGRPRLALLSNVSGNSRRGAVVVNINSMYFAYVPKKPHQVSKKACALPFSSSFSCCENCRTCFFCVQVITAWP